MLCTDLLFTLALLPVLGARRPGAGRLYVLGRSPASDRLDRYRFIRYSGILLLVLAFQPPIEVYEHHLVLGRRIIPWGEIRRLDRTSWMTPLIVNLTLTGDRRVVLVYPGDIDAGKSLLRHLRRCAKDALIDGIPYRQFWGEVLPGGSDRRQIAFAAVSVASARRRSRG